jgi:hypothetical protein
MMTLIKAMLSLMVAFLAICKPAVPALPTVENYYPLTALVVDFNEEEDIVICEDYAGNIWKFEGIEDWMEGDLVSMLMDSKGTPLIFDDEILLVRYSGWIGHYGAD